MSEPSSERSASTSLRSMEVTALGLLRLVDHDHLLVLEVIDVPPVVGADQDLQQVGVQTHAAPPSCRMMTSSAAVRSARSSGVRASTFSRSSGSVFDGRTLHHQSSYSTVSPSSRSCRPSASAVESSSIFAAWSATSELISPESAYCLNGSSTTES